jgi:hypothetical protein
MNKETGMMMSKSQGKISTNKFKKSEIEMPFSVINFMKEIALANQISETKTPTITKK